jgi:hypothetical protein
MLLLTSQRYRPKKKKKKTTAVETKEVIKKRTAKPSPKKHIVGKDAAADIPRTSNKDDIAKDLAVTEVDKDNFTAGASSNNNVTGKAAAAKISSTAPSKEDSILNPSTIAPNTANMLPSINVSGANVAITNLPVIASPSAGASTALTNHQNSRHRLPGDKIVSIYM